MFTGLGSRGGRRRRGWSWFRPELHRIPLIGKDPIDGFVFFLPVRPVIEYESDVARAAKFGGPLQGRIEANADTSAFGIASKRRVGKGAQRCAHVSVTAN